ncbi:YVTN family beta-propeller repeat protein [Clostridium butyricum]|uniref:YVTN family beta-propeller repeat protein n=1 Tax=Clostridium butyricum TaxID=1492 RepID=UPI0003D5F1E8|nr:MAG: 40-residue YVTN family beta-propeller repeat protein [Clostridium butyricum DORA_1]MDU1509582.1 YncE family protein [Clostridium butyricum]MDU4802355.1 YncE family protein [Clostridium butyricum]
MIRKKYIKLMAAFAVVTATLTACSNANNTAKENTTIEQTQDENKTQTQNGVEEKTHFYYTANESGSISKIDAATNEVIDTIKEAEGTPHNVQVSPDGKVVGYTLAAKMEEGETKDEKMDMNMEEKSFAVFYDIDTGKLIKKVEVGNHPAHIVFTEDGKYVLVTNSEDNTVSVIDVKTYKVTNTITVGKGPHGFRISKDSKFAYVANMNEDTISVVDIENNKEVKKITVGNTPVTTGITSDGKTIIATVNGENALAIVDLETEKVEKIPVGVGPAQVYIQSDSKYAFVANQGTEEKPSNTVSKIDLATRKVIATIETGKGTHGVVVSPDNKYVYATNMYEQTVSVIDNSTNKVIKTVKVDEIPNGISFR